MKVELEYVRTLGLDYKAVKVTIDGPAEAVDALRGVLKDAVAGVKNDWVDKRRKELAEAMERYEER